MIYVISMEFLSLSRRRSSSRTIPSGEERGETDVFAGHKLNMLAADHIYHNKEEPTKHRKPCLTSTPREGGYSTNVYTGRLHPKVQPLTLLYTIFHEKGTPYVCLLLTNGTPFTYLGWNVASLLIAVNVLSFK